MNKKVWALVAALCLSVVSLTVFAATEHWNDASATPYVHTSTELSPFTGFQTWKKNWDDIKTDFEQISLTPGQDETELNFGWYSKEPDSAKIRIFTKSSSSSASEPKEFEGTFKEGTLIDGVQYYTNKVTVTGLEPDTTYYYQYLLNGEWQKRARLDTQDPESFSVLYVGDPQIGASVKQTPKNGDGEAQSAEIAARNDSFNWNVALNQAMAAHPDVSFLLSAGDQITGRKGNRQERNTRILPVSLSYDEEGIHPCRISYRQKK